MRSGTIPSSISTRFMTRWIRMFVLISWGYTMLEHWKRGCSTNTETSWSWWKELAATTTSHLRYYEDSLREIHSSRNSSMPWWTHLSGTVWRLWRRWPWVCKDFTAQCSGWHPFLQMLCPPCVVTTGVDAVVVWHPDVDIWKGGPKYEYEEDGWVGMATIPCSRR